MSEPPFKRVVLICDAACDIRVAVADAASLAARWDAELHGVFIDDENLRRFAALPFGRHVSLSNPAVTEELTAGSMANLSSAFGARMKRLLADVAKAHGLQWTFGAIRDLPSAASVSAQEGDILVVEAMARAFSGAWRPRAAWEKSPAAFSGTVLVKARGRSADGVLVLLPENEADREKVLAASAALAAADEEITIAGEDTVLAETKDLIDKYLQAGRRRPVAKVPLDKDRSALTRVVADRGPGLIVLHADESAEWLDDTRADLLFVR